MKILTFTLETLSRHVFVFALKACSIRHSSWKLFPFSLKAKGRQWYDRAVGKQQGD